MPIQGTIAPTKTGREQPPTPDEISLKPTIDCRRRTKQLNRWRFKQRSAAETGAEMITIWLPFRLSAVP
jgi:hypothetical protein